MERYSVRGWTMGISSSKRWISLLVGRKHLRTRLDPVMWLRLKSECSPWPSRSWAALTARTRQSPTASLVIRVFISRLGSLGGWLSHTKHEWKRVICTNHTAFQVFWTCHFFDYLLLRLPLRYLYLDASFDLSLSWSLVLVSGPWGGWALVV